MVGHAAVAAHQNHRLPYNLRLWLYSFHRVSSLIYGLRRTLVHALRTACEELLTVFVRAWCEQ